MSRAAPHYERASRLHQVSMPLKELPELLSIKSAALPIGKTNKTTEN